MRSCRTCPNGVVRNQIYCPSCRVSVGREKQKRQYEKHRDKILVSRKRKYVKPDKATSARYRYRITAEEYAELMTPGRLCEICGELPTVPHIDHDHASGLVRGILCFCCNVGIGHLKDDPERVRKALEYLTRKGA